MQELGIEQIFARSPQAKGRVERMAGTFQDRLVSELRLAGARTIDEASEVLQEFLPRFNNQFPVPAQQPQVAYRALDASLSLERILLLQAPAPGGQGQYGQVPVAHSATASSPRPAQLCRGEGGGAGAQRRTTDGPVSGGSDCPPGSSTQGGSAAGRPGGSRANSGTGPGGQEPEPAQPHQVATPAPGRVGSACRPTGG